VDPAVGIVLVRPVHVLGDIIVRLVLTDIAAARVALVEIEEAVRLTPTPY
jgi:hypothetical protein